jgi:hypothetical protein
MEDLFRALGIDGTKAPEPKPGLLPGSDEGLEEWPGTPYTGPGTKYAFEDFQFSALMLAADFMAGTATRPIGRILDLGDPASIALLAILVGHLLEPGDLSTLLILLNERRS